MPCHCGHPQNMACAGLSCPYSDGSDTNQPSPAPTWPPHSVMLSTAQIRIQPPGSETESCESQEVSYCSSLLGSSSVRKWAQEACSQSHGSLTAASMSTPYTELTIIQMTAVPFKYSPITVSQCGNVSFPPYFLPITNPVKETHIHISHCTMNCLTEFPWLSSFATPAPGSPMPSCLLTFQKRKRN
jgi:hypothetical protein